MIIGLTDPLKEGPTLGLYVDWIKGNDPNIEVRVFSSLRGNAADLQICDALVLSGGNDVHPRLYGRMDAWEKVKDVDEQRDQFELALIDSALNAGLPVLGICRGAQIFNVARGGTLIPDLQDAGFSDHRKSKTGERVHSVTIEADSLLRAILGRDDAKVNTSHHQAIDRPGQGLRISARASDGVAEAVEWADPEGKPFLLVVQWHPERMMDVQSPAAVNIRDSFLKYIRSTPLHHT